MDIQFDQPQQNDSAGEPVGLVSLGDAAELTLGQGGRGGEDKRRQYN